LIKKKVIFGMSILAIVMTMTIQSPVSTIILSNQAGTPASDQPPVIVCSGIVNTATAGLAGYDPDGTVISVKVTWGDGMSESSNIWNYCTNVSDFVKPPQLGHIFTHQYANPGNYYIVISLIDNAGLATSMSWQVTSGVPTSV
jgi:hypothetical protein